jgi:DNA repair ATPase RecN
VQTIGELTSRRDDLIALLTRERADNARLREQAYGPGGESDTRLRDELARAGAEVEGLRGDLDRSTKVIEELRAVHQERESRLTWYREALQVLRGRLGLDHLDEDEDVMEQMLEAVASMTHAVSRHQELAAAAEKRVDQAGRALADIRAALEASESDEQTVTVAHRRMAIIKTLDRLYNAAEDRANLLQNDLARRDAIIARLREQVAATDEALAEQELLEPGPAPAVPASTWADESLLADFGRRVLRGEVAVQFLGVRP